MYQPLWIIQKVATAKPGCVYFVKTQDPVVAITIDDGPDHRSTPQILQILSEYGGRATFFLTSSRVKGNEHLVRAILRDGHEIGNHLTRDELSINLDPRAFEAALVQAQSELSAYTDVQWFRPGSGWYNYKMISIIARHGLRCALGSVYPYDAHIPSAWFASYFVLKKTRSGSIMILHDGGSRGERTAQVLSRVLPEFSRRGLETVTLSELIDRAVAID